MRAQLQDAAWPLWIRLVSGVVPALLVVGVALQRSAVTDWVVAAVAAAPFALIALGVAVPWQASAVLVIGAVGHLAGHGPADDLAPFFLVILAGQVGSSYPRRVGAMVVLASAAVLLFWQVRRVDNAWLLWTLGIGLGWVFGSGFQQLLLLSERLSTAQLGLAQAAAADERRRIAREVHDVVAHSLTVTMLHITAARLSVESDPAQAREALEEAERAGRRGMADLRTTVGLLGDGGDEALEALPGAGDIDAMVGELRRAGLDVEWRAEGDVAAVPPAVGLALYRAAQEAITNAAKHAAGSSVDVALDVRADRAVLSVANPLGPRATGDGGGGRGLPGMAERIEALGGTVVAAPADGRWQVRVDVPLVVA